MHLSQINTPEKDIMLSLTRGYISNLQNDLAKAQQYLQQKQWIELRNLAHSIQGAAGGFGFIKIGEVILQLESDIIEEKFENAPQRLAKAQKDLTYFTNIPHIDLPLGLFNFDQNLEMWHFCLLQLGLGYSTHLTNLKRDLLKNSLGDNSPLIELKNNVSKLGMLSAANLCLQIITAIHKEKNQDIANDYIVRLDNEFKEIELYCRARKL